MVRSVRRSSRRRVRNTRRSARRSSRRRSVRRSSKRRSSKRRSVRRSSKRRSSKRRRIISRRYNMRGGLGPGAITAITGAGLVALAGGSVVIRERYRKLPPDVKERTDNAIQIIQDTLFSDENVSTREYFFLKSELDKLLEPRMDEIAKALKGPVDGKGKREHGIVLSRHFDTALLKKATDLNLEANKMDDGEEKNKYNKTELAIVRLVGATTDFQMKLFKLQALRKTISVIGINKRSLGEHDYEKLVQGKIKTMRKDINAKEGGPDFLSGLDSKGIDDEEKMKEMDAFLLRDYETKLERFYTMKRRINEDYQDEDFAQVIEDDFFKANGPPVEHLIDRMQIYMDKEGSPLSEM